MVQSRQWVMVLCVLRPTNVNRWWFVLPPRTWDGRLCDDRRVCLRSTRLVLRPRVQGPAGKVPWGLAQRVALAVCMLRGVLAVYWRCTGGVHAPRCGRGPFAGCLYHACSPLPALGPCAACTCRRESALAALAHASEHDRPGAMRDRLTVSVWTVLVGCLSGLQEVRAQCVV